MDTVIQYPDISTKRQLDLLQLSDLQLLISFSHLLYNQLVQLLQDAPKEQAWQSGYEGSQFGCVILHLSHTRAAGKPTAGWRVRVVGGGASIARAGGRQRGRLAAEAGESL